MQVFSVKCPQKPKFEKNWLAKDLTLGDKGLKFVVVRQKKTVFRAGFCEWWSWWRTIKKLRGCGNVADGGISIKYPYFDAYLIRLVHSILVSTNNPEKNCHLSHHQPHLQQFNLWALLPYLLSTSSCKNQF